MEVLTAVDAGRIEALRARDEFFWLDLHDPPDDELDGAGGAARPAPARAGGLARVQPAPEARPLPEAVLLVYWSRAHHAGPARRRARRDPPAHLGRLPRHGPPRHLHGARRPARRGSRGATPRPRTHRLPRARRADRRAVPGRRQPRGAHRRARGRGAERHRPATSSARSTGSSRRSSASSAGSSRSATSSAGHRGDHGAARARRTARASTCATSATISRRSPGELHRQADDLARADVDLLQREPNRLNRLRDAAHGAGDVLPDLDARDELLRPELRLARAPHRLVRRRSSLYEASALVVPTILAAVYFWRRRREWL